MKYLLTGMIALTLLTACGQKDKAGGDGSRASVVYDAGDLAEVKVRSGDPATAGAALAALSLSESGAGRIAFAASDVKGDTAVFTDIVLSMPEEAAEAEPSGLSEEDLAGMFSYMDTDGDGIADDGSNMTIEDLRIEMESVYGDSTPAVPPVVKAAKLEFSGLAMVDGVANFGLMKLTDITITPGEGSEENNTGKIASVELVNPSPETAAWVAGLLGKGGAADFPEGKALSFDRWVVKGVNFTLDDASGSGVFTLDSIHLSDLKDEKAGLFGISNLNFDFAEPMGSDTKITLEGFGVRGVNYGLFSEAIEAGAGMTSDTGALASAIQADPANPGYDAISVKALKADIVGASVDMPSLESNVSRDKQGRATKVVTKPFTFTVAARDNPDGEQFAGMLASVGFEKLSFSGQGEALYEPDADIVTLPKGKNYWALENGFKLNFSAKYEGTKAIAALSTQPDALAGNSEEALNTLMDAVAVHQFELALDDDGILDAAINAIATQQGTDPAEFRKSLILPLSMAPMFASQMGIDQPVATELATALTGFLQEPKTLTISFAPKAPLKAQAFMDAAADPTNKKLTKESLGFSASNK